MAPAPEADSEHDQLDGANCPAYVTLGVQVVGVLHRRRRQSPEIPYCLDLSRPL